MPTIRNSAKAIIVRDGRLLCIECADSEGAFYLLPGGGQEHGETLTDALKRECREEVSAEVAVHDLRFIREYRSWDHEFAVVEGDCHQIEFMFFCTLQEGSEPRPGAVPDGPQTGIAWLPLEELSSLRLYPSALKTVIPACFDSDGQEISCQNYTISPCIYLGDIN